MKAPRTIHLLLLTLGIGLVAGAGFDAKAEPPLGEHRLARGIVNSTWTWSTRANDPAPKVKVTIHNDETVTWSDRPSLHSPYTIVDEFTIHQNQSIWKFSPDLRTLTVERDHAVIRYGRRIE